MRTAAFVLALLASASSLAQAFSYRRMSPAEMTVWADVIVIGKLTAEKPESPDARLKVSHVLKGEKPGRRIEISHPKGYPLYAAGLKEDMVVWLVRSPQGYRLLNFDNSIRPLEDSLRDYDISARMLTDPLLKKIRSDLDVLGDPKRHIGLDKPAEDEVLCHWIVRSWYQATHPWSVRGTVKPFDAVEGAAHAEIVAFLKRAAARPPSPARELAQDLLTDFAGIPRHVARGGLFEESKAALAAGADVNLRYSDSWSPLMEAAAQGHADLARLLLRAGADIGAKDAQGNAALYHALAADSLETARLLLESKADPNVRLDEGKTLLMLAAEEGSSEEAELLARHGADVNAADRHGRSVLFHALLNKSLEIGRLLIDRGAKAEVSAETLSRFSGSTAIYARTLLLLLAGGRPDVNRFVSRSGAITSRDYYDSNPPLIWMAQLKEPGLTKKLLDKGAAVNIRNWDGETALIEAVNSRSSETAKVLLAAGADPNAESRAAACLTPLGLAISNRDAAMLALLLERGADVKRRNCAGRTALQEARRAGDPEIKRLVETAAR